MSTPFVSVLMTVYNRERYIAEAIESVLAQTFTNFELIVVDDGSSDRSVEIATGYTKDPRVRLHINDKNLGDYPNRNHAASLAQGKYLKYLDADDMMYPQCLEIMVHQMELFPEVALGFTKDLGLEWLYPFVLAPADAYRMEFLSSSVLTNGPTFAIFRASVFKEFGGFPVDSMTSDTAFSLTVALKHSILFSSPNLVYYRYHAEQESSLGFTRIEVFARYFRIKHNALRDARPLLDDTEWRLAAKNLIGIHLRIIGRKILGGRWKAAARAWCLSELTWRDFRWIFIASHHFSAVELGITPRTISPNWKCFLNAPHTVT